MDKAKTLGRGLIRIEMLASHHLSGCHDIGCRKAVLSIQRMAQDALAKAKVTERPSVHK